MQNAKYFEKPERKAECKSPCVIYKTNILNVVLHNLNE